MALVLAEKILSLFLIIAMGFALVKSGAMKAEQSRGISIACLYVISPCMIVSAFQVDLTADVVNGFLLALGAGAIVQVVFLLLSGLLKRPLRLDPVERTSMAYSNCGNLIIPLVLMMFGQGMVIYCTAYIVIQTFLFWSHAKSVLQGTHGIEWRSILLSVNMISIYIGLALFATGLRLPGPVSQAVSSVGQMIGPASMLVCGMIMGGMDFKKVFSFRRLPLAVALRLVALPLVAVAILKFSPLSSLVPGGSDILLITLLAASAPSASTVANMAQVYHCNAQYASAVNAATILLCIVTMPAMVALYQL